MFLVKPKHDNYSLSYCYEGFVIVIKLLLYLLDFEIGKTEFQCLLRLEVDIDFNRNTTYSSEKKPLHFYDDTQGFDYKLYLTIIRMKNKYFLGKNKMNAPFNVF